MNLWQMDHLQFAKCVFIQISQTYTLGQHFYVNSEQRAESVKIITYFY